MKFFLYFYFVTLLNGLVLIAALLIRKENRLPNLILSCLLAVVLFGQGIIVLYLSGGNDRYSALLSIRYPIRFLVPSLFYLYVESLTVPDFRLSRRHGLHFIPFFASLVIYFLAWFAAYASPGLTTAEALLAGRYVMIILITLALGFYLWASFRRLREFRALIPQYFSELMRVRLTWLNVILVLFSIPWLIGLADVLTGPYIFSFEEVIVPVVTICILVMGFFGLKQSVIFSADEAWGGKKELKPLFFSPEELARTKDRLEKYMEKQRPYLEPELRLIDLAKGLSLKPYQLSEALNRGVGATFFDFINRYRIEEAKRLLKDPSSSNSKILAIAMDCGFNSKSSFNETFRKFTGMTPSEFREK